MDSLTQITLGAAVVEAVLGRRIGNRAMVWGAIGGTIPDLDIIANFFMEPIPALAFHRGITHSLLFSITVPLLLAWLVHRLYATQSHQRLGYKIPISLLNTTLLIGILVGLYFAFGKSVLLLALFLLIGGYFLWRLYRYYLGKELENIQASYGNWYLLFFLAFSTHFLLDCFTAFGTQVFQPFSDYRVAFNNIAVIDPLYTVPFLICVIIACNIQRHKRKRSIVNSLGIILSSAYMLFTILNKQYVDGVFQKALDNRNIEYTRCRTSPTIFNNFLWNCVAEDDSVYYAGLYSIFDSDPNLHHLNVVPKNNALAHHIRDLKEYHQLQWFSDGYLMHSQTDSALIISDIRYGGMGDTITSHRDLVFNFFVTKKPDGSYFFTESRERPDDVGEAFRKLWVRIKGY